MHRMHRAPGLLGIVILLAACAAPGSGGEPTEREAATSPATSDPMSGEAAPSGSASAEAETTGDRRIDMAALAADPSAAVAREITVLARVDQVVVDGLAFLTSPSASDDGQIAVIVRPDGQVDKEIAEGRMVFVDGTVVGFTAEELETAGVGIGTEELGEFGGEFAIVADAVRDPLADDASS